MQRILPRKRPTYMKRMPTYFSFDGAFHATTLGDPGRRTAGGRLTLDARGVPWVSQVLGGGGWLPC